MKLLLLLCFHTCLVLGEEFATGTRLFSASVYKELLPDNDDNILVSPFSVETVLALTQSGAFGGTGSEIRTTLHLANTKSAVETEIQQVLPTIQSETYSLNTANKIYVENGLPVKDSFKLVAANIYNAALENINFVETEAAKEEINNWVAEETNNKISNLLSSDDIGPDTIAILINALYFQANWSIPFIPQYTKKNIFFVNSKETININMMHLDSAYYNYAESEELDAQLLEIPFVGDAASMVVILPNQKEGIALLEKRIDVTLIEPAFRKEYVEIYLPKFQIESTIDFNNVLQQLGIHKAFNPNEADFSGIAGAPGDLFISKIKQKTFIDVSEIGVEAAAATEIGIIKSGSPIATKPFIADHPFMFYIKVQDLILFEGRVVLPKYDK